jgi:hypothetical protein
VYILAWTSVTQSLRRIVCDELCGMIIESDISRQVASGNPENSWKFACQEASMKQRVDKETHSYPVPASEEQSRPEDTAGQSGDTQGLSDVAEAGSESVAELVEEGQFFEAGLIAGVEDAPDPDVAEVHTKQVPEDDVPSEYLDQD